MLTDHILGSEMKTGGGGGANLLGNTKGSEETEGSPVRFVSGNDSNVIVHTAGDELRIDVYYV